MSDIVVNKIINFKSTDQVTPTANKVKQAIDGIKDKSIKLGATPEEQGITAFGQKLQGLPKDVQTILKAMAEKNGFDTFEGYMKTVPRDKYTQLKANVEKGGFQAFKNDLESLPRSQQAKLKAIAEKEGFTTFEQYYRKVPKEARTKLDAIADTHDVDEFIRETEKIPKHLNTKVDADVSSGNSALSNFSGHVEKAKEKTGQFKSILAGSFVGSMMTTGLMSIVGGLKSATASAMEYANAQQTMNATWKTLTGNAKDGQKMVDMTNQMAIAANNSTHMVDQLNQKFYSVNGSAETTKKLTSSVLTLQDAFGKTDDEVENFGTQWGQMVANGKVSAQDMMSFVNVFPKLRIELLKTEQKMTGNKNLTMKQLNDMISAGKVSSDTMDKVLEDTATKYGKATKNFSATIAGMKRTIQSQVPVLLSAFTEPFLNAQNPIYKTVSDWVADKRTKDKFGDLGKTISNGMSDAMSALSGGTGGQKNFTDNLNRGIDSVNKGFKVFFGYITDHAKDLKTVGGSLNEILKVFLNAIWKDVGSIITTIGSGLGLMKNNSKDASDPLHAVADALKGIAKHKTAIKAIAGYLVAMKTFKMAKGAFDPLLKLAGIKSKGSGLLTKVIGSGENKKTVFRFGTEGIAATKKQLLGLKDLLGKVTQGGKFSKVDVGDMSKGAKIGTGVATAGIAAGAGLDIVGAIKAKNPEKKFEGFGKAAGTAIGGGVGFMLGGPAGEAAGAMLGRTLGKYGGKAAKNFTDGWNKAGRGAKPPKGMLQKAGYYSRKAGDAVAEWAKGVVTFGKKHKEEILLTLANPFLGIGDWILKDTKTGKDFQKWASNAVKNVQKGFKSFTKKAGQIGKDITKTIVKGMKGFGKMVLYALALPIGIGMMIAKPLVKPLKKATSDLINGLKKDWKVFTKWLSNIFAPIGKAWSKTWKKVSKSISDISKSIQKSKFAKNLEKQFKSAQKTAKSWGTSMGKWWSSFSKDFGKKWDKTWRDRKTGMQNAWKGMHSAYDNFASGMSKWWLGFSSDFAKKWNDTWRDRKTNIHDNFKNMHSAYDDFATGINKWWSGFSSSFKTGWDSFWKGVQKLFKDIFGTFKDLAHDAMKGVVGAINTGIGGINTVIKFFGGKAKAIAPIKYATGVGYHPGGPALLNDQKGSVYEEAFKNPGEPWRIIPKLRNVMVDLKPGATVVPANETARRFAPSSVPHYAGGVGSWIKGELSDMGSWVKDKLEGITSFLKDPLGNLTSVWDKAVSKITQPTKFGNVFAPPAGHFVVKQSVDWVKNVLSKLKDKELEAQSVAGEPKAAQAWLPIVKKLMEQMGAKPPKGIDWEAAAFVREIARESGGNPTVRQAMSDYNSRMGNPAMGLLQFIPQTFMSYAVPGHTNILSGEDQIMATINAYMHSGAWWRIGTGRQINFLANGGWTNGPSVAGEVPGEPEMVINPARSSSVPLLFDLIGKMADFHPEFRMSSSLTNNVSSDIGRKLDAVITLLGSINGKDYQPEINIARTSSNFNQQNRRETDMYAYQRGDRQ